MKKNNKVKKLEKPESAVSESPATFKLLGFAGDFDTTDHLVPVTAVFMNTDGDYYIPLIGACRLIINFIPFDVASFTGKRVFLPIGKKVSGNCLVMYQPSKFPGIRKSTYQVGDILEELPAFISRA